MCFGGVMHAANSTIHVVTTESNPTDTSDEDKVKKNCTKILQEAAKKACVKKEQEEAKAKETVKTENIATAKPKTISATSIAKQDVTQEEDEELITPMFGRTLYNFLKSLML